MSLAGWSGAGSWAPPGCGSPDISYPSKLVGELPVNNHSSHHLLGNRCLDWGWFLHSKSVQYHPWDQKLRMCGLAQLIRLAVNWITQRPHSQSMCVFRGSTIQAPLGKLVYSLRMLTSEANSMNLASYCVTSCFDSLSISFVLRSNACLLLLSFTTNTQTHTPKKRDQI